MANKTVTVKSSGGDYASLNAALAGEDDINPDLTAMAGILTIACYAFQDTTPADTGTGYTTSEAYYLLITCAAGEGHQGVWSESKYRIEITSAAHSLTAKEGFTRVIGLQASATTATSDNRAAIVVDGANANSCRLEANLVREMGSGSNRSGIAVSSGTPGPAFVYNNIVYDFSDTEGAGIQVQTATTPSRIYGNTVAHCNIGIYTSYADAYVEMNLLYACTTPISGTTAARGDYNATDASALSYGDSGTTNTHDRVSQSFGFVSDGGRDYHLTVSDDGARDHGTDYSTYYTLDVDGVARIGTWDIGADEYVAAGGQSAPVFRRAMSGWRR